MKSSLLAPLVALAVAALSACYVAPTSTSTPPAEGTATPENADVGATPELLQESAHVAPLTEVGIAFDQPLEDVMTAARAADKADKTGKTKNVIAIMKAFKDSLGVECSHCHVEKLDAKGQPIIDPKTNHASLDFAADHPEKSITKHMWNDWVANLRFKETGAPVFCDSCHQKQPTFLDRDDSEKLGAWMKKNFNEKLTDAEGNDLKCSNCHGKPFKKNLLTEWREEAKGG